MTQENQYNGNGQRIQKKETKGQEAKANNYYYQNGALLYTADEGGKRTSLNLMGAENNVIATARDEKWYLYNKDVRESTSSLVDETGAVATAYEYDAFGNTTVRAGGDFENEICYTGQIYDQGTGLYYYNARFYDPENGRFVSQDSYRGEQKEPGTWHLYTYCANNPVNYVDPSGHKRRIPNRDYSTSRTKYFKVFPYRHVLIEAKLIISWKVRQKEINWRRAVVKGKYYRRRNHTWRIKKLQEIKNEDYYNKQRAYLKERMVFQNIRTGLYKFYTYGVWIYNDGGRDWD